jgi:hypothetical protein
MGIAGPLLFAAGTASAGVATKMLAPKPPSAPAPPPMPSLAAENQAQTLTEAQEAAARYGRAATVLTTNADTGDRLGP